MFFDKINQLPQITPNQNTRQTYKRFQKLNKQQNYQILNETKTLHQKKSHFSKTQIKEFSVLFIMLNYLNIALQKVEDISQIKFLSEKNESLKKLIISLLLEGHNQSMIQSKIGSDYKKLIEEIHENSSIHIMMSYMD